MALDNSILMQKQVRDNSEDLLSEFLDLKNWEEQMKRKEKEILSERNGQPIIPPIRSKNKKKCVLNEYKTSNDSKRIKSYDYASWDKFDVNKACEELDKEEQSDDSSEESLSKEELKENHNKALEYKEQGNAFVKQKEWGKAIASYSEAIKICPFDATFYANRALCHLKQDNLYSVEADCSSAIQLDKTYVKAYHRRATARIGLKQYKEAIEDIKKMIDLEPHNKEAEALLNQVKKQSGNSFMSEKDTDTTNISHKVKINKEEIKIKDNKNKKSVINENAEKSTITKEEKNKESNINIDSDIKLTTVKKNRNKNIDKNVNITVKPAVIKNDKDTKNINVDIAGEPTITNVAKLKKNQIPDWLPEKDNVKIVEPINKLPHLRSKEPLKRIFVQEADLSKPIKDKLKAPCDKEQYIDPTNIHSENILVSKLEENFTKSHEEILPIPTTAVQFLMDWKKSTLLDYRYRYLKQIPSGNLPKIFQDSMETDIFSDILATLKTEFTKRREPIFSYLKDLSNVKRFRAFTMFISSSEKQDLKLMFSYCKTFEKISEKEITDLKNKYEII
ncbi:RNA polymerase II-associated protein 3 [Pogonomyrmex barbatus]|uniref:RNA polymerase II-associated protein 3 n=1 Tax=Pogonomyrmex barbatus TaxID=144034 RepID=A0A6I9WAR8_9HYME|nr:RNA polymerase II-associated protein 3 [Pogonomyrmex barbatus]